ncbi:MAG TPA: hypothetical protein VGK64_04545 [Bryobacteraceae bacterium]
MSQTATVDTHNCGSAAFSPALFTDLYELTMAQAYDAEQMEDVAVFELSFRGTARKPQLYHCSRT